MVSHTPNQGERIRALFKAAVRQVSIIAPFIKKDALQSLLEATPLNVPIRCITRWLPRDIAAGVSDPEILELLKKRGNFRLTLVDNLHAKIYISDSHCLVGSANVTHTGLGDSTGDNNIEILVETIIDDIGVVSTLHEVSQRERVATDQDALTARYLADQLTAVTIPVDGKIAPWIPRSRKPERAYSIYQTPPSGFITAAERLVLVDIASANISPGQNEDAFRVSVRNQLALIPPAAELLAGSRDLLLTKSDALPYLGTIEDSTYSSNDIWLSFVAWMSFFFPDVVMRQEITESALRRASEI